MKPTSAYPIKNENGEIIGYKICEINPDTSYDCPCNNPVTTVKTYEEAIAWMIENFKQKQLTESTFSINDTLIEKNISIA